mmetsp:Transcript_12588/g.36556  ORF Transcript_12588/g.36556 Transcript_12588/m.36556 type:complete len:209 (+) Transcript_12588:418-1044(+)
MRDGAIAGLPGLQSACPLAPCIPVCCPLLHDRLARCLAGGREEVGSVSAAAARQRLVASPVGLGGRGDFEEWPIVGRHVRAAGHVGASPTGLPPPPGSHLDASPHLAAVQLRRRAHPVVTYCVSLMIPPHSWAQKEACRRSRRMRSSLCWGDRRWRLTTRRYFTFRSHLSAAARFLVAERKDLRWPTLPRRWTPPKGSSLDAALLSIS